MINNKVTLIGNLGKDPESRTLESNKKVCTFSLATKGYKDATDWHNIVCWEKVADIASLYCFKGSKIAIDGKISYREYESKDGTKKHITEIIANEILLLDSKKESQQPKEEKPQTNFDELNKSAGDDLPY